MKKLEEFKTMEELLQYKKELETIITDDGILDEVVDNIWMELSDINSYVNDIISTKNTNRKWLSIILTILGSRSYKEQYKIKVYNESSSKTSIYTLDNSMHHATVEEKNINKEYNTVLFTSDKNAYNTIVYEEFCGKFNMDTYLDEEKEFSKIIDILENNGLTDKELKILYKYIFDNYKKELETNKTKVRKRD